MNHPKTFSSSQSVTVTGKSRRSLAAPLRMVALSIAVSAAMGVSMAWAQSDDYAEVNRLLRAGQLADALGKADQYLAGKPRDPQMRFLKGVIQTESGKPTDAIATFSKLTEDFPELPEPYNNLAVLYAGQSQFDKARAALEMAIRTNPSYATAHENLGDVYAKLASQAYSKALQLDAGNAGVAPKLSLIRNLFAADAKGVKPTSAAPAAAAPVAATKPPVAAPAPAATTAAAAPAARCSHAGGTRSGQQRPGRCRSGCACLGQGLVVEEHVRLPRCLCIQLHATRWPDAQRLGSRPQGPHRAAQQDRCRRQRHGRDAQRRPRFGAFPSGLCSDSISVSSRKTLDLVKSGNRWLIVRESTGS